MATPNPRPEPAVEGSPGTGSSTSPVRRAPEIRTEHFALAAILALSCLLEFNKLSQNGYANIFYSAAVKSMLRSLHNFFFVAFDPGGLETVDKPPLALWLQAGSAKIFGFAPLSLLIPQAICAVVAVALMYFIVRPRFGAVPALIAALALAVFPSFVAVGRDNAIDPLMILLMVAASGLALRAIDSGRTRTLFLSALVVGLAFNTKSLAGLLCVPGIAIGYLLCAPGSMRRRIVQLALGGAVLAVVSLSWSVAVDLTPASQRPYVGGSTNNSELQLAFGYNGVGRAGGQVGGPPCPQVYPRPVSTLPIIRPAAPKTAPSSAPPGPSTGASGSSGATGPTGSPGVTVRNPKPVPFASCPSALRIFGVGLGDQGGWTVPIGVIGLLALAFAVRRKWRDRRGGLLYVFGGWFLVELLFLDFSKGIVHPYYASALGPGLAAMVAVAAAILTRLVRSEDQRRAAAGLALAAFMAIATAGVEVFLINRHGYPGFWRVPLVILAVATLLAMALWRRGATWTVAALMLVLLFAPAVYSASVWDAPVDGTFPNAGPYNRAGWGGISVPPDVLVANRALAHYIRTHHPTKRFAVLTEASDGSAVLILLGLDAAALAGYSATDPALSGDGLARLVADHEARYVIVGGPYADRGGNGASTAARLVCPQIPQALWYPAAPAQGSLHLVDCRGRAAALRHPYAAARAYLHAHPIQLTVKLGHAVEDLTGLRTEITAQVLGSGPATVAIGASDAVTQLAPTTVSGTGTRRLEFALPANWYFKITLAGSATLGAVTQTTS
jgi:4-amino-4-deoxy-L-arabinose transferase-like glycosyltransferase